MHCENDIKRLKTEVKEVRRGSARKQDVSTFNTYLWCNQSFDKGQRWKETDVFVCVCVGVCLHKHGCYSQTYQTAM